MLYEIMRHCRNFFPVEHKEDNFVIKDGIISLPFIHEGQYYLIEGSIFNDGLYKKGAEELTDEEFTGVITALAIPKAFLELATEIEAFVQKNPASPFQSESFGGYSYTRATKGSSSNAGGGVATWKDVFSDRLQNWRKI